MGKKGHDLPKNLRQELVLSIVENFAGSDGILTSEIFELLDNRCPGVNRRTLHRDLIELSQRYPLYDETIEGRSKWFVREDLEESSMKSLYRDYIQKELFLFLKRSEEVNELEAGIITDSTFILSHFF